VRVEFDADRCASVGMCESVAPDVFEVGADGYLVVLEPEPDEAHRAEVESACDSCPTGALRVEG